MRLVRSADEGAQDEDGLIFFPKECETIAVNRVELPFQQVTIPAIHTDEEEIYLIQRGHGVILLNDVPYPVSAGDVVYIPRNTTHAVQGQSEPTLVYICVANWPDKPGRG